VLRGVSPSVTFTLRYDADRSAVGTAWVNAATVTNTTTGVNVTIANQPIPDNNWVWIEITATAGTVSGMALSIEY
jgi:hypothetical protein